VPKALAEIAARAMAKDPEHRYRSARAFARELRHWLEEHADADGGTATALPGAPAPSRRLAATLAATAVLLAAGLWFVLSSRGNPPSAEAAARTVPLVVPMVVPAVAAGPVVAAGPPPAPAMVAASATAEVPTTVAPPAAAPAPNRPALAAVPRALPLAAPKTTAKEAPRESAKERRARDSELRVAAKPTTPKSAATLATGVVRIAVSPWGHVEVNGNPAGTTPPLTELSLPEGKHQITLRNEDFPAHTTTVNVVAGQPVNVKHKFGS
jgi:hypothetical protein